MASNSLLIVLHACVPNTHYSPISQTQNSNNFSNQAIFQAKTQAKMFLLNWAPDGLRDGPRHPHLHHPALRLRQDEESQRELGILVAVADVHERSQVGASVGQSGGPRQGAILK